jgi:pimeloyl-ACP methyl ester carboxylesterase
VVCLDLPGVGTEHGRRSPSRIEGISDDLRRRFRAAVPSGARFGLFSVSLGGMVALDWVRRFPEDFELAVIVNSSAGDLSRPQERLRLETIRLLLGMMREADPVARERRLLEIITNHRGEDEALAQKWGELARSTPVPVSVLRSQLVAAMRFQTPEPVATRLEFFVSARDRLVDPSCTYRLAERYRSPIQVHPTAGHELPLDDPDWVIDRLSRLG